MVKQYMISYCITVYDEFEYIQNLIESIFSFIADQEEIIVVQTYKNLEEQNSENYKKITNFLKQNSRINYNTFHFQNRFDKLKNYMGSLATKPYILNLDADEILKEPTINLLRQIIIDNQHIDLFYLPRINTVDGLTQQDINKWSWTITDNGWVNWPDYQPRLYKNSPNILWQGEVHETVVGYNQRGILQAHQDYAIIHHKTIDRQRFQNALYDTITKK